VHDELNGLKGLTPDKAAEKKLLELGNLARPMLRRVLAAKPALEVRSRIERLLETLVKPVTAPATLRSLRGVEALERIGTREARHLLHDLAAGAEGAAQTEEAGKSFTRLARQAMPNR
jgi:hypothetical protein